MARDTSFYYAFLILPAPQRAAIVAVWDFCRAVDDAVDEAAPAGGGLSPSARMRATTDLENWRTEIDRCYGSGVPRTRQGRALQPFVQQFRLTRQPFDDLVDGVAMDLARDRYQTFDELSRYCMRVASAVGLICVEIFGCRTPSAREYAINLGIALQLTNILRDLREDAGRGRVYLPAEDLRQYGYSEADLLAGRADERFDHLMRFQIERARRYYAESEAGVPWLVGDASRLTVRVMGRLYAGILTAIEELDGDVFRTRAHVPFARKLATLAACQAETWRDRARRYWA